MTTQRPVAVVTGAAQGIGAATARAFVLRGMDVRLLDLSAAVKDTAASLTSGGPGRASSYRCDVAEEDDVRQVAGAIVGEAGGIDVLVNNAGWTPNERFLDQDRETWDRILAVNLQAVLWTTAAFAPHLRPGGAIVNVASDAARVGVPREAVYAAAKAGVIAFSKSMAVELARQQVRVNVVSPGTTETPLVEAALTTEQRERRIRANPLGRLGKASEVAEAIRWLACDAEYVTGQVLSINGGATRVD